jgi:hypothetical protein
MDHFGIGHAVAACLGMYINSARRTGRTTSLVESLKDGDRVVCLAGNEAQRLRELVRERGVDVEVIVVPIDQPHKLFEQAPAVGRTIFDHTWVEAFYERSIRHTMEHLDHLERQASGFGAAHRETARAARERMTWSPLKP